MFFTCSMRSTIVSKYRSPLDFQIMIEFFHFRSESFSNDHIFGQISTDLNVFNNCTPMISTFYTFPTASHSFQLAGRFIKSIFGRHHYGEIFTFTYWMSATAYLGQKKLSLFILIFRRRKYYASKRHLCDKGKGQRVKTVNLLV